MEHKNKLPDVLDLPSGGKAWFRDLDASPLTGRDQKRWRKVYNHTGLGDWGIYSQQILAETFIVRWEFPHLPNLPLPSDNDEVLDLLRLDDLQALDRALSPMIELLTGPGNAQGTGPGTPTPPGSV